MGAKMETLFIAIQFSYSGRNYGGGIVPTPEDCSSPMTPRTAATKNAEIMQEFQRLQQEGQLSPKTAADKIIQNRYTAEDLAGSGPEEQEIDTAEAASH